MQETSRDEQGDRPPMALPDEAAAGDGRPVVATKKSAWTKEEDAALREQVKVHGAQNWATISEALPGRSLKSCRLRWCQHLSPDVEKILPFTRQEDEKIMAYYGRYNRKWSTIRKFLLGRTDNAIKNRWNSVLHRVYEQRQAAAGGCTHAPPTPRDVGFVSFEAAGCQEVQRHMTNPPPLHHPEPDGVDLSGECLKLFPLVPGDLVRESNASEATAMDVDYSIHESLVQLTL